MAEGHGQAHFTAAPADKVGWYMTVLAGEVAPCLGEDEREVCAVRNAPDVVGVLSDVHSQWLTGRTPAVRGEGMACS